MVFRGQDLWRAAPIFKFGFTDVVPGFREAVVLFAVYLGYEAAMSRSGGAAHHGGAGDAHHAAAAPHGAADAHAEHLGLSAAAAAAHGTHGGGHAAAGTAKLH
jgi:hypothetical protein